MFLMTGRLGSIYLSKRIEETELIEQYGFERSVTFDEMTQYDAIGFRVYVKSGCVVEIRLQCFHAEVERSFIDISVPTKVHQHSQPCSIYAVVQTLMRLRVDVRTLRYETHTNRNFGTSSGLVILIDPIDETVEYIRTANPDNYTERKLLNSTQT